MKRILFTILCAVMALNVALSAETESKIDWTYQTVGGVSYYYDRSVEGSKGNYPVIEDGRLCFQNDKGEWICDSVPECYVGDFFDTDVTIPKYVGMTLTACKDRNHRQTTKKATCYFKVKGPYARQPFLVNSKVLYLKADITNWERGKDGEILFDKEFFYLMKLYTLTLEEDYYDSGGKKRNGVTTIPTNLFDKTQLEKFALSAPSLSKLGDGTESAFRKSNLKEITFESSVQVDLPDNVCADCSNLRYFTLKYRDADKANIHGVVGKNAFLNDEFVRVIKLECIDIIDEQAFCGISYWESFDINRSDNRSVKKIGDRAFYNGRIPSLSRALVFDSSAKDWLSGVEEIGQEAFAHTNLDKLSFIGYIPKKIGKEAFAYCTDLDVFTFDKMYDADQLSPYIVSVGTATDIFKGCTNLKEITGYIQNESLFWDLEDVGDQIVCWAWTTLSKQITNFTWKGPACNYIPNRLLYNTPNLKTLTVDCDKKTEAYVGKCAFNASALTTFPMPIRYAGSAAFSGSALQYVKLGTAKVDPKKLGVVIKDYAFARTNVKNVYFPDANYTLEEFAFAESKVEHVSMKDITQEWKGDGELYTIPIFMFQNCPLTELSLPENTKVISGQAFVGHKLKQINIPDQVTTIDNLAYATTDNTERKLRIGKMVTDIDKTAFIHLDSKGKADGKETIKDLTWLNSEYKEGSIKDLFPAVETIHFGDKKAVCEAIPERLCMGMPKLKTVDFPAGVEGIGVCSFRDCPELTSVTIPEICESIGDSAFYNDAKLTSISILPTGKLKSIGQRAFKETGTSVSKSTFVLPKRLQTLGAEAMPAHTSMIAYYARKLENERPFVGYDQITDVTLREGVEVLPNGLFSGTGVSSITIPSTVTKLGNDLLVDCKNLGNNMKIYYNAKNAEYTPKYDDAYNYIDPSSIPEVKDQLWLLNPWGVEKIAHVVNKLKYYDDFSGYSESTLAKMYDVVIGDGVESIPDFCFTGFRTHRHEFAVPASVTHIGFDAFSGSDVRKVNAPQLKKIGESAFCTADSLREIHMPEVTTVGNYGFAYCKNLKSVDIPKVEQYGGYSFMFTPLTSVSFPATLEQIGVAAFMNTELAKCDLSAAKPGLKIIESAFRNTHLSNLLLPEGAILEENAFTNSGLKMMMLTNLSAAPQIESNTFDNVARDIPLYISCAAKPSFDADDTWKGFTQQYVRSSYSLLLTPPSMEEGIVNVTTPDCDNKVTVEAIPAKFFSFKQWSDGNTENPRTITLTEDMELAAEFEKTGSYTMRYMLFELDDPSHGEIAPNPSGWYAIEYEGAAEKGPINGVIVTSNDHYIIDFAKSVGVYDKSGNWLNTSLSFMCQSDLGLGNCIEASLSLDYAGWDDLLSPTCSDTVYITIPTAGEAVMLRDWFERNDDEAGVLCQYYDIEDYNYKWYSIYDRPGSYGETVQIYAHASEGYAFTGWDDGVKDEIRTFTVGDRVHTANFEPIRLFVTFNTNLPQFATIGGQVFYEQDYVYGDKVYLPDAADLEIIEAAGKFNHWEVNGSAEFETETDGEKIWLKNPIKEDLTITAVFDHKVVTMSVSSDDDKKGTVAVSSDAPYHYGDQITVTATPKNVDYTLEKWSDGPVEAERVITLTQDTSLVAIFVGNSYTVSLTIIPEGTASAVGMGEYSFGDEFTLQVIPEEGYELKEWRNGTALEEKSNTLKGTVDGNMSIEAEFQLKTLTISTEVNNDEAGIILGGGTFTYGTEIELTAKAFAHYVFAGWEDDVTLPEKRTVTVTENTTYKANFESEFVTVTVEADETMGRAETSIEGEVAFGTELTLTATAFTGYEFTGWSDDNKDNPRTLTANKTQTLTALFAPKKYKVTIGEFDAKGGTVTLNHADGIYEYLETAEIIAEPAAGYIFVEWSNGDTEAEYCIIVQEDVTLTPKFAKDSGTGIDQTPTTNDQLPMTKKIIIDNQLYILVGDRIYDATGRLVK